MPFSAKELEPEMTPIPLTAPCLDASFKSDRLAKEQPYTLVVILIAAGLFLLPVVFLRCVVNIERDATAERVGTSGVLHRATLHPLP